MGKGFSGAWKAGMNWCGQMSPKHPVDFVCHTRMAWTPALWPNSFVLTKMYFWGSPICLYVAHSLQNLPIHVPVLMYFKDNSAGSIACFIHPQPSIWKIFSSDPLNLSSSGSLHFTRCVTHRIVVSDKTGDCKSSVSVKFSTKTFRQLAGCTSI